MNKLDVFYLCSKDLHMLDNTLSFKAGEKYIKINSDLDEICLRDKQGIPHWVDGEWLKHFTKLK